MSGGTGSVTSTTWTSRSAVRCSPLRALDARRLDGIVSLAQPRRVEQNDRRTVEIELHLDHVTRGARDSGHDRHLAPGQAD